MKRILSYVLTAVIIITLLAACSAQNSQSKVNGTPCSDVTEHPAEQDFKTHTLYFKDSTKSDTATATLFNIESGDSKDVVMKKAGEDSDFVTFSCEGDASAYDMAYITYG